MSIEKKLELSTEQYKAAVKTLHHKQVEILRMLYSFPESTATALELAYMINPNSTSNIIASGQIGKIGKSIANFLNVEPYKYNSGRGKLVPAYFSLIGPYFINEGKKVTDRQGWKMNDNLKAALISLNLVSRYENENAILYNLPTEEIFENAQFLKEGKVTEVFVNRYERNSKARVECIKHYGYTCYVCEFDFEKKYGEIGKNFIQVHHKKQLSEIGEEYIIDPINDLVPLCSNCHSVIHFKNPAYTIEELKNFLKRKYS
jgi:predicted HNH restriction endonuclease